VWSLAVQRVERPKWFEETLWILGKQGFECQFLCYLENNVFGEPLKNVISLSNGKGTTS